MTAANVRDKKVPDNRPDMKAADQIQFLFSKEPAQGSMWTGSDYIWADKGISSFWVNKMKMVPIHCPKVMQLEEFKRYMAVIQRWSWREFIQRLIMASGHEYQLPRSENLCVDLRGLFRGQRFIIAAFINEHSPIEVWYKRPNEAHKLIEADWTQAFKLQLLGRLMGIGNVLNPLPKACLNRMQDLSEEDDELVDSVNERIVELGWELFPPS